MIYIDGSKLMCEFDYSLIHLVEENHDQTAQFFTLLNL
jgi:hypothetical protein